MEDPPVCRGRLCRLCHGDFKTNYQKKFHSVPSYAKPTASTMRRTIAVYLDAPPKPRSKNLRSNTRLGFEDLPAEIRVQIYRYCLRTPNFQALNVLISAWVKGGGLHADRSPSRYSPLMHIHASHSFPRNVLVLNKRIHGEALREIYKSITFRIGAFMLSSHLPQIKYWLSVHPMRLATRLEIPAGIMIADQPILQFYKHYLQRKVLTVDQLVQLNRIFSKMPNLKQLTIILVITVDCGTCPEALKAAAKQSLWKKRLSDLCTSLPVLCKATVIVKANNASSRTVNREIESLRLEAGFLKLVRSAFSTDMCEVRPYVSSDGTYGISTHALLFQIITDYS